RPECCGALVLREPFQSLEIFEPLDCEQFRVGRTRFAALADEAHEAGPPRVVLVDTAMDQQVDAPSPCEGGFCDIRAVHPTPPCKSSEIDLPFFPDNCQEDFGWLARCAAQWTNRY